MRTYGSAYWPSTIRNIPVRSRRKGEMQQCFKSQRTVGFTTTLRHRHGTLLRQCAPRCKRIEHHFQRQRGRQTGTNVHCQATNQSIPAFLTDEIFAELQGKSRAELAPHIGPIKVAKLPGIGRSFSPHNCHVIRCCFNSCLTHMQTVSAVLQYRTGIFLLSSALVYAVYVAIASCVKTFFGIGTSSSADIRQCRCQKGCGDDKRCQSRGAAGCLHPFGVFPP